MMIKFTAHGTFCDRFYKDRGSTGRIIQKHRKRVRKICRFRHTVDRKASYKDIFSTIIDNGVIVRTAIKRIRRDRAANSRYFVLMTVLFLVRQDHFQGFIRIPLLFYCLILLIDLLNNYHNHENKNYQGDKDEDDLVCRQAFKKSSRISYGG